MRFRNNGGVIGTTVTANSNGAIGMWSISEYTQKLLSSAWPTDNTGALLADPFFNYNTLLLKAVGNNNQQNYTFLDSSSVGSTITRNGDVTQGAFSPYAYSDGYWGAYFDGGSNRLTTGTSSQFNLNATNFTIECWVFMTAAPSVTNRLITIGPNNAQSSFVFEITTSRVLAIGVPFGSGGSVNSGSNLIPLNAWTHLAFTLSGSTGTCYINGSQVGQTTGWNITSTSSNYFYVGYDSTATVDGKFTGYISNVRLVKGSVIYSGSSFTPPTSPLTAVSGTTYLSCQSNYFKDNSTNNFSITRNGEIKVSPFGPLNPSSGYDPTVTGGAMYFDGTGDYLSSSVTTESQLGTSDFTIEAWIYPMSTAGNDKNIFQQQDSTGVSNSGLGIMLFQKTNRTIYFGWCHGSTQSNINPATTVDLYAWSHIAGVRSGNTFSLYINGVLAGSTTSAVTINSTTFNQIGFYNNNNVTLYPFTGFISNVRLVKGTAVYTSAFTPPTATLTPITNTSLLVTGTNAGIIDGARKVSVLYTVGDTKVSTSVTKFTKSIAFDGTGDYISTPYAKVVYDWWTSDFTLEYWVYPVTLSTWSYFDGTRQRPIGVGHMANDTDSNYWSFSPISDGTVRFYYYNGAAQAVTSTQTVNANQWSHIAMTKTSSGITIYVNGVASSTTAVSGTPQSSESFPLVIGRHNGNAVNGYIEDLRITKGYARYSGNFTPPIAAFSTR